MIKPKRIRFLWKNLLPYCALVCISVFTCFPILWMILTSLKPATEIYSDPPKFLPQHLDIGSYYRAFTVYFFGTYFKNTIIVAFATSLLCVIAGSLGAYSLTRYRFRGREFAANLTLITYMFAPIMIAIPLFVLLSKLGLTNSRLGLILSYTTMGLPLSLWMLRSFFLGVSVSLEEAAWLDGANRIQGIIHILLPSVLPGLIAVTIFVFVIAANDYILALVLLSTDRLFTLPIGISNYMEGFGVDWAVVQAVGVIATIPIIGAFFYLQKYFVKGWGVGGLK